MATFLAPKHEIRLNLMLIQKPVWLSFLWGTQRWYFKDYFNMFYPYNESHRGPMTSMSKKHFCFPQKKDSHSGLEWHKGEKMMREFSLWLHCLFKHGRDAYKYTNAIWLVATINPSSLWSTCYLHTGTKLSF